MSSVEEIEIEAAIVLLADLRNRASAGPWIADVEVRGDCVLWGNRGKFLTNVQSDQRSWPTEVDAPGKQSVMFDVDRNDTLLMEVLHRTIDAQLRILEQAKNYERSLIGTGSAEEFHRGALDLARAINGTSA